MDLGRSLFESVSVMGYTFSCPLPSLHMHVWTGFIVFRQESFHQNMYLNFVTLQKLI